jgi:metal-responsive CopG/Arc/MetJ family transcriptional regulator
MSTDEYTTVRLPKELMEEIDSILKRGVMGYKSRAEFIKEVIREKLNLKSFLKKKPFSICFFKPFI